MTITELCRAFNAGAIIHISHDRDGRDEGGNLWLIQQQTRNQWRIHYGRYTRIVNQDSYIAALVIRR